MSLGASCVSSPQKLQQGPARVFEKPGTSIGKLPKRSSHDLYYKEKTVSIVPVEKPNTTGSLFNLEDERNYLFAARGPLTVGRFIDIKVGSVRVANAADGNKKKEKAEDSDSSVESALLKALPNLEPKAEDAVLIKRFKMKIAHRYANGDVLAVAQRTSEGDDDRSEISLQARIPYQNLISGKMLTTNDLTDVNMVENSDGEVIERRSSSWEDDYTMRMSGFSEAKSKVASRLDDQRQQLSKIRDQLRNRLISAGKERKQMANERNKLMESGQISKLQIEKLNKSLAQKDELINSQKTALADKEKELAEKDSEKTKENDDAESGK